MSEYDVLTTRLTEQGIDVPTLEEKLAALEIETPSWGYGDSGHPVWRVSSARASAGCRSRSSRTRQRRTG